MGFTCMKSAQIPSLILVVYHDDDSVDDCDDGNGHLQKSSPKDVRKGVLVERRNDPIVVTPGRARVGFHMHEKCSNTFSYTCTIR